MTAKGFGTVSSVPVVSDCGLGLGTLSQSNLLKIDRVKNETKRVILGSTKELFWEQQKTHDCGHAYISWTCHQWRLDRRWSKSKCTSVRCRIPRIHSMMLFKNRRGVDWQEASHGWGKQISQSSMCAAQSH